MTEKNDLKIIKHDGYKVLGLKPVPLSESPFFIQSIMRDDWEPVSVVVIGAINESPLSIPSNNTPAVMIYIKKHFCVGEYFIPPMIVTNYEKAVDREMEY